jgi:hypothetical protein
MHASRLPRSRSLVAGGVLLAAAMAASASCPAADRPPTIYLIGNSLTLDSSPEALAGPGLPAENVRWHLDGDASLRKRPMKRVTGPLAAMGARFN